jgi:hypothetical protein
VSYFIILLCLNTIWFYSSGAWVNFSEIMALHGIFKNRYTKRTCICLWWLHCCQGVQSILGSAATAGSL